MPHINNSKNSAHTHTHIESSYNKYLRTYNNLHIDWLGEKNDFFFFNLPTYLFNPTLVRHTGHLIALIIMNFKHGKPVLLIVHVVQWSRSSVSPIFFQSINVIHAYRFREED